jgi:hypothetical protein
MDDVRDLVYLDFDKASSIWSQFEGGLRERVSITADDGKGQSMGVKFGIPKVAEATLGADYVQKRSTLETKVLHHDVLNRVDAELSGHGLVIDVSKTIDESEAEPENIRNAIGSTPYVKATGQCVIEDYPRILSICEKYNDIIKFIGKCGMQSIEQSPEYLELQSQIEDARNRIGSIKDRNQKAVEKQKLKALESTIGDMGAEQLRGVEQWLLDGIKLWINTFMPTRINFRTYPLPACPSFQVLCNLKRECFVDQDPEHLLYGYGNRPNVALTVFGLVTSIPPKEEDLFDPMTEFADESKLDEKVVFEKAFRAIFGAMDEIEAFVRYSRYPNITVHPIAIYRSFATLTNKSV